MLIFCFVFLLYRWLFWAEHPFVSLLPYSEVKMYYAIVYAVRSSCYCPQFPQCETINLCLHILQSAVLIPSSGNRRTEGWVLKSFGHWDTTSNGSSSGPVSTWRLLNTSQTLKVKTGIPIFNKLFILSCVLCLFVCFELDFFVCWVGLVGCVEKGEQGDVRERRR